MYLNTVLIIDKNCRVITGKLALPCSIKRRVIQLHVFQNIYV